MFVQAVIKSRGPGISPGYYECGLRLLSLENRRKIEPKEIPSRLIPRLLVVYTQQLEILVTTLFVFMYVYHRICLDVKYGPQSRGSFVCCQWIQN